MQNILNKPIGLSGSSNHNDSVCIGLTNDESYARMQFSQMSDLEIKQLIRNIKFELLDGKYKCTSAYKIPDNFYNWHKCPNCNLYPLTWEYNNGNSTGCGCGRNDYDHFSIHSESIMSHVTRNNGSALYYDPKKLMLNWNYWVDTGIELEPYSELRKLDRW